MILVISDFDLRGSGYMNIATSICQDLSRRGYDVKALGYGYKGQEHSFNFSIIPVPSQGAVSYSSAALQNMIKLNLDIEALIVALDIPLQINYAEMPECANIPYIGIFPIESPPLPRTWAMKLSQVDHPLVISRFGTGEAKKAGLEAQYIEIGLDLESWRLPEDEEREKIRRSLGLSEDDKFILTVADNHERKNLSAAVQALSKIKDKHNFQWGLVSRIVFRAGWNLHDLVDEYGIADRFMPYERGLEFKRLWALYAAADAFLLTSKSEGLCMPILEAMALKIPIVATDCTAITEHLIDGRGMLCPVEYEHQDVWGNAWRSYVNTKGVAKQLDKLFSMKEAKRQAMVDKAYEYVSSRTLEGAGDVVDNILQNEIRRKDADVKEKIKIAASVAVL